MINSLLENYCMAAVLSGLQTNFKTEVLVIKMNTSLHTPTGTQGLHALAQ